MTTARKKRIKMFPISEPSHGERITSLETSVAAIEVDIADTNKLVHGLFAKVEQGFSALRTEMETRRIPLAVWVSLAGVAVVAFGILVSALYVPIWITTANINAKAQSALDWQGEYIRGEIPSPKISEIQKQFKEIETQFRLSGAIHNMHFAEQQRMNNILLQIAQGVKPVKYPEGPYFFPEVTDHDQ